MPSELTCLRVFIASPSGLAEERKAFRDEIQEFNEADAIQRGVLFQPVGWEDTLGGIGRPQTIINEDVRSADYFVLLLWNRWGSPPDTSSSSSRFTSGTEEEYHVALECYDAQQATMRQIVIMLKSVDPQQLSDPGPELQKVLEFRNDIEQQKTHLFHSFDTTGSFRKLIRRHLAAWLRDEENGGVVQKPAVPMVEPGIVEDFAATWQHQRQNPSESSMTAKAWALADEGRLTESEVEFARNVVGQQRPQPLIEYGRFLSRLGRLDQATVMFEAAFTVAKDQGDQSSVAIAYGNLGNVHRVRGDLDGAERMHRKSLEIEEGLGRLEGMASQYGNLGNLHRVRGDLEGAEQMHRKSLEIEEGLGHLEGMAGDYGNLGIVLRARGDLDGAEQMHRKSLEINESLGRLEGMASDYGNLGIMLQDRGDLDGAEQMYLKSLEINESLGRLEGMANQYGNLGILLQVRGDLDGAEQMYLKSLEIEERLGRLEGMASDYGNLGNVLQVRGDLDGAEQMHRKSLEIEERLGHLEGMASDYGNLGNVLQVRGDLDGAEQMYLKSLETAERLGSSQLITRAKSRLSSLRNPPSKIADNE